jgi:uncharacterized membrane protein
VKKYFITGLLVWLPLAVTIWVLTWATGLLNGIFVTLVSGLQALLPVSLHGALEDTKHIPGLGIGLVVLGLLATGLFVANIFGQWWLGQWHRLMSHIPIVKSIYTSVKQVSDTLFSSSGQAFREAVLVEYPRAGSWTVAFVTGKPGGEVAEHLPGEHLSLYVPTTPNPTSGFFIMVPRSAVVPLAMSVDAALKYIISMGVVVPEAASSSAPVAALPESAPSPRI